MSDSKNYQVCKRCIMDTTDPLISFDENGVCNHCRTFDSETSKNWFPNEEGERRLAQIIEKIKKDGTGKKYDCIFGLSGGVDSSYLALKIKDFGLRPLVMHVDAGWNTEISVFNVEQVVKHCGYDLHTHVVNWEEMKDLQLAYLKSAIANQDVPQDHAFFASMYHFAVENKIKYFISGGNLATESVLPVSWWHAAMDSKNLRAIHKKHGKMPLKQYETINIFQYYIAYPFFKKMKTIRPLNFMNYNKKEALEYLIREIGYKVYERKHGESVFTKFYINHYLPVKFNYDMRRAHLSSLILSGQMSRADALIEFEKPLYAPDELTEDMDYIAKKLGISMEEFKKIIQIERRDYSEYKNWDAGFKFLKFIQNSLEKISRKRIRNYS